jgi:Lon protease-like protein
MNKEEIPLFPLGVFLLPKEEEELHVFEKRYIQLVNEAVEENSSFGIPYTRDLKLMKHGSLVRVKKVLKSLKDGRKDILIECIDNFELSTYTKTEGFNLYSSGQIKILDNLSGFIASKALAKLFKNYMVKFYDQDELQEYEYISLADIAITIELETAQKINLIATQRVREKEKLLSNAIKYLLLLKSQEEKLDFNFYLN